MADYARGELLRRLRDGRHLSQERAALEIGVSTKTLREWEHGGKIHWKNAKRVAAFYGQDPEMLVSRDLTPLEESEPVPTQLDRIEGILNELLDRLVADGVLRPVAASSARAARVVAEETIRIQEAAGSPPKPKPGQRGTPRVAPRRKTA